MKGHPWLKGPPFETPFDEQVWFNCIYASCMQQWASLEDGLGSAFFPVFGRHYLTARSVFYATQGLKAKIGLVEAAYLCFASGSTIYEVWKTIKKRTEKSVIDRNRMTHGQLITDTTAESGQRQRIKEPHFSVAPYLSGKTFNIYGSDIIRMQKKAFDVSRDLEALGLVVESLVSPGSKMLEHYNLEESFERLGLKQDQLPKLTDDMISETVFGYNA